MGGLRAAAYQRLRLPCVRGNCDWHLPELATEVDVRAVCSRSGSTEHENGSHVTPSDGSSYEKNSG